MIVEVEVNSRCNRRCSYCPVSLQPIPDAPRLMADRIFDRLVDELAALGFAGRLSYHFYNEPLIRKDLEQLVARADARLPAARQVLFTNGDLLTHERYVALVSAGIDQFIVTRHDESPIEDRPRQTVLLPSDLDLTNRGGVLFNIPSPLELPCHAPSEMLIVTATGDVVLCYEDARRQHIMGNIMRSTVREIWESPRFQELRALLTAGGRAAATEICAQCNNRDHVQPRR